MPSSDAIDLSIKATVSWVENNDTTTLSHISFRLYHRPLTKTAYFKLRIPLNFKPATATASSENKTSPVWVFITPEQIDHLSVQDKDDTNNTHLLFRFSRAPQIVVPLGDFAVDESSRDKWADINSLARATSFRISSPDLSASKDRLLGLCGIASRRELATDKNAVNMVSLYGGKGGRVFEPPPAYVEATPNPSPPARPSAKRRRANSDDSLSLKLRKVLENDIGKLRAELRKKLKETPLKEADSRVCVATQVPDIVEQPPTELTDDSDRRVEKRLQKIEQRLQVLEDGHHGQVEQQMQSLEKRLQRLAEDENHRVEKHLHRLNQRIEELETRLQRQEGSCERGLDDVRRELGDSQYAEFEDLKCTMIDLEQNLEKSLEDGLDDIWERFKSRLCDIL